MKNIINYFIRYHVAVNVVIIAFLLFGILGLRSLKSSFFPLTESHVIRIAVIYPGASPMEIEEGVILKIVIKNDGVLLIIDYGYFQEQMKNTLQSIYNQKYSNVLENIGKSDITHSINFFLFDKNWSV